MSDTPCPGDEWSDEMERDETDALRSECDHQYNQVKDLQAENEKLKDEVEGLRSQYTLKAISESNRKREYYASQQRLKDERPEHRDTKKQNAALRASEAEAVKLLFAASGPLEFARPTGSKLQIDIDAFLKNREDAK